MTLTTYRTLGRSGLAISPLTLGTMTFGTERWGTDQTGSRAVFDAYLAAGGNSIDTADVYASGRSEEMVGAFVADAGARDRLVIATKAGFGRGTGNPHAGGNGAKNIYAALEGSLRRLRTDYVDLFWIHVWDRVTPAEEVLETLAALVRAGKIRHYGLSNVPGWYAAKLATLAAAHGLPRPIGFQLEYSLVERAIEREHLPAAAEFGMGLLPWSPLAGGFLTGRYRRGEGDKAEVDGDARLTGSNPFGEQKFTERNWRLLDVLRTVAEEAGRPPAQIALAWAAQRPGVSSVIIGASREAQLAENIAALEVRLTDEQRATLDAASAPEPAYPYAIFSDKMNRFVFADTVVEKWRPA